MPWCCFEVQTIISVPCLSDCNRYQGMEEILHGGDIHPTHSRLSQVPCGLSQAMDQGRIGKQSTGSKQTQPHRSSPQDTPSPAHHEVTVGLSLLQEAPRAGPALLHHHSTPAVGLPKAPYSIFQGGKSCLGAKHLSLRDPRSPCHPTPQAVHSSSPAINISWQQPAPGCHRGCFTDMGRPSRYPAC